MALVVGTILNLINQGDALLVNATINWTKLVLTYLVPYAVAIYGAIWYQPSRQQPRLPHASEAAEGRTP